MCAAQIAIVSPSGRNKRRAPFTTVSPASQYERVRVLYDTLSYVSVGLNTSPPSSSVQSPPHSSPDAEIAALIHHFLSHRSGSAVLSHLRQQLDTPLITSIAAAHQRAANRDKKQFASLVTPHYTRDTVSALGFHISANGFTTAQRHARTLYPGAPPPPPPRPPSKLPPSEETIASLSSFLNTHSQLAACRTVLVDDVETPTRILSATYSELHRRWKELHPSHLRALSSFIAAVKRLHVYKPPSKRSTDMCDHCVEGAHSRTQYCPDR